VLGRGRRNDHFLGARALAGEKRKRAKKNPPLFSLIECTGGALSYFDLFFEFGGAEGGEEGVRKAKVVGVRDEIATILGRERGDVDGFPLKGVDEALAESEGEVGRKISVSGAGFRETSLEEASEVGPPLCKAIPISDTNVTWR